MKFYLPDFFFKFNLNTLFIELWQTSPEVFNENVNIGAIYGSFPGAIWNGGRLMCGSVIIQDIEGMINRYNEMDMPVRFTFTNSLLREEHIYDTYCNLIMEAANNGMNEVLVNSPILEDYLRTKYPDFKYILSTTRCERDIDKINIFTKQYDMVVTDFRDNNNFSFLEQITEKNKIELLVNSYCNPNCSRRLQHYEKISNNQLLYRVAETENQDVMDCPTYRRNFYDIFELDSVITVDSLYQNYIPMGFENFKIEGRTSHIANVVESYIYYLIKPEYQNKIRLYLLRNCIPSNE